jgi:hypothetical protein
VSKYAPFSLVCTSVDDDNNRVAVVGPDGREVGVSWGTGAKGRVIAWERAEEIAIERAAEFRRQLALEKDERIMQRRQMTGTRADRA